MKTLFTKMLMVAGLVGTMAFAQDEPPAQKGRDAGVGIKAAFNYDMMYGFKEQDDDVDGDPSGIGFDVGLATRMEMVSNLYLVPEINFAYNSTDHKYLGDKRTYTSYNLEIPVMFRGIIAQRFYANAGPQINLCLSDKAKLKSKELKNAAGTFQFDMEENVKQTKFSFGLVMGGGINIAAGLYADFRFYMGLSELFPDTKSTNDVDNLDETDNFSIIDMSGAKMMGIKIGIGYWFI